MEIELINSDSLYKFKDFYHVGVAKNATIIAIGGQSSIDVNGEIVGPGDLHRQIEQVFRNILVALNELEMDEKNILKYTTYLSKFDAETYRKYVKGKRKCAEVLGVELAQPNTVVGVTALAHPELLVEIECLAAKR